MINGLLHTSCGYGAGTVSRSCHTTSFLHVSVFRDQMENLQQGGISDPQYLMRLAKRLQQAQQGGFWKITSGRLSWQIYTGHGNIWCINHEKAKSWCGSRFASYQMDWCLHASPVVLNYTQRTEFHITWSISQVFVHLNLWNSVSKAHILFGFKRVIICGCSCCNSTEQLVIMVLSWISHEFKKIILTINCK